LNSLRPLNELFLLDNLMACLYSVYQHQAMFKVLHRSPDIPKTLSPEGQDFLEQCFQRNPADRPSAAVLLTHPFVQNLHERDVIVYSQGCHKEDTIVYSQGCPKEDTGPRVSASYI